MCFVCVRARAIRYDSELAYDGEYDEPSVYYFRDNAVMGSDSEDDDDDDVDDDMVSDSEDVDAGRRDTGRLGRYRD